MFLITCSVQQCTKQVFNKVLHTIFEKKSLILIFLAFWADKSSKNFLSHGRKFDFLKLLAMIDNIQLRSILMFLNQNFQEYFIKALFFIGVQSFYSSFISPHFKKQYIKERIKIKNMLMTRIFHYQKLKPGRIHVNKLLSVQNFYMDSIEQIIDIIASFIVFVILSSFLPDAGTLWLQVCAIIVAVIMSTFFITYFLHKQVDSQIMQNIYDIDWFNLSFIDIVYFFFLTICCYFIPMYILKMGDDVVKGVNLFIFYIVLFRNALVSNKTFFKDFIRSWVTIRNIMRETKIPSFEKKISSLNISSKEYDFEFLSGNIYWLCSEPSLQSKLQKQIIFGQKRINSVVSDSNLLQKCSIVIKENSDLSLLQYFQLAIHNITAEDIVKTLSLCKFFEGEEHDFISEDFLQQKCSSFSEEQQAILAISRAILDNSEVLIIKDCFRSLKEERERNIIDLFGNKKIIIIFSGSKRPPITESFVNSKDEELYKLYINSNK